MECAEYSVPEIHKPLGCPRSFSWKLMKLKYSNEVMKSCFDLDPKLGKAISNKEGGLPMTFPKRSKITLQKKEGSYD